MTLFRTERLEVFALNAQTAKAAAEDRQALEEHLGVSVDPDWPLPDFAKYLPVMARMMGEDPSLVPYGGLIIVREAHVVVGELGLHGAPVDGKAEVGYSVVPRWRGRGIATEAVTGLVNWAFEKLTLTRLMACTEPDNAASQRVLQKAGFLRSAHLDRDNLRSFLKELGK